MLESSARIETLASAWEQMNSETPLAAPPAALQVRVRKINIRKKIMSDWHLGLALEFQKITDKLKSSCLNIYLQFVRRAGVCGQIYALIKRFIFYKQPTSILSWISK